MGFFDSLNPFKKKQVITLAENMGMAPSRSRADGSSGTDITGGVINEEYLSDLVGSSASDIFDKMRRSDPKVKMCLMAIMNPIKGATWSVEPADETPDAQKQADLVTKAILESRKKRWEIFLHEILTMIPFGYSLFERTHETVLDDPEFGTYVTYKSFGWRSPRTIERWNLDKDTGKLVSVDQFAFGDSQKNSTMDARFLTLFSMDREGDLFEGMSMLRPCYGAWLRKNTYLKLQAIGIEKYAVPTPILSVPEGRENSPQFANAKAVLQAYTSHQSQFITLPEGWSFVLTPTTFDSSKVQASIDAENAEIVNAFMANFLLLGQSGSGSWALSTDLSDFFLGGIEHIASQICEVFNDQVIPEIIDINFGPQKNYPFMQCSGISDKAGKELAEILNILATSQYIKPDDRLEEHLRVRYGLPEVDTESTREPPAPPAPQMPGQVMPGAPAKPDAESDPEPEKTDPSGENPDPDEEPKASDEKSITLVDKNGSIVLAEPPRRQMTNDTKAMRALMKENTAIMGRALVKRVMSRLSKTSAATRTSAIKNQKISGTSKYSAALLDQLAETSERALMRARGEVPKQKNAKLAEFELLPKDLQKRLKSQSKLLAETQAADLEKAVFFQFNSGIDQPDEFIRRDLNEAVDTFSEGPSVTASAGNSTALAVNEARNAFFFSNDVLEEVYAFKFVNTDPISAICRNISNEGAGRVFDKDDPAAASFMPPLHHNCKSYIVPILKGGAEPDISPYGLSPVGEEEVVARALKSITLSEKGLTKKKRR